MIMHGLHVSDVKFARATDILTFQGLAAARLLQTISKNLKLVKQERTMKNKFSVGKFRLEILDFLSKKKKPKESVKLDTHQNSLA